MRNYIIIFIVYELLMGAYFYTQYTQKVENYRDNVASVVKNSLSSAVKTFTLITDDFHSVHTDSLAQLLNQASSSDVQNLARVREDMLKKYIEFYRSKTLDIFAGMHIFDKSGNSLLRFHKPYSFGDPIIAKRDSLQALYKEYLFQSGLEVGLYDISYRYQYPLFYDGAFVGAYEYNLDFTKMLEVSEKFLKQDFIPLFHAQKIEKTMKPEEVAKSFNKVMIGREAFYFKKGMCKNSEKREHFEFILKMGELKSLASKEEAHFIEYKFNAKKYSLFLLALQDISQENLGFMIVSLEENTTQIYLRTLIEEMLIASILSLAVLFLMLKELKHKAYVRSLLDRQKDILIVTDGSNIKDTNQSFLNFFGYKTLDDFKSEHDCVCDFFEEEDGFLQKYNSGVSWIDILHKYPNATQKVKIINPTTSQITIFELEFESFTQRNSFVLLRDITREYHKSVELHNRASYDALTKIYNRVSFEHELSKELKNASRYGSKFSLIMFDIDHFKNVNDSYGHDVGDIILKEITALVSDAIRETDFFARWGGEEFMIITHSDILSSETFAEKLRSLIQEYKFTQVGTITSSFGVAQYRSNDTKESLVKRCDEMLYSAKNSGRNCVVSIR